MSLIDSSKRITQLDGLRGIAVILVVLTHMRLDQLYKVLPSFVHPLADMFIGNGKVGVYLLFMLSGFLMATIYPQVGSMIAFWQKRYTRIFPPFIAMCVGLTIVRFFWQSLPLAAIPSILVLVMALGGLIWRQLQKVQTPQNLGRKIFLAFLAFQALTVVGYLALTTWVPPAVFYQIWPQWLQSLLLLISNATLTLPFGTYLGQLDGVYWSLISEVFFYLLYPVVIVPCFLMVRSQKSNLVKLLVFCSLFPFLYGLNRLFQGIFLFSMLQIHFMVFFLSGVLIGYSFLSQPVKNLQQQAKKINPILLCLLCLVGIAGQPLLRQVIHIPSVIDALFWVFPLSLVFLVTLSDTAWSVVLNNRILRTLGEYSYSIYLTHTISIEMFTRKNSPTSFNEMVVVTALGLAMTGLLSYLLHYYLELPYFNRPKKAKALKTSKGVSEVNEKRISPQRVLVGLAASLVVLIWMRNRVPVSLSALVVGHQISGLEKTRVLTTTPVKLNFQASAPNLGVLLLHLRPLSDAEVSLLGFWRGPGDLSDMQAKLSSGGELVAESSYKLYQISESRFHPIGIPIQANSNARDYDLELSVTDSRAYHFVSLLSEDVSLRSVYFISKQELLTNPQLLMRVAVSRIFQPLTERSSFKIMLLCVPLLLCLWLSLQKVKIPTRFGHRG
jgi:peptidoglycan/LPS O-acetylase OafA/YrhL